MIRGNKEDLLQRLKKIEGQVRGVSRMIEEDRYCVDVLMQIAAIRAGVTKIGVTVMEDHIRGCVTRAIQENHGDQHVDELMDVLLKFVK
ncbi:MAG: metal-sensitive transcriptional regulator [Carboxydocellales bacterium]